MWLVDNKKVSCCLVPITLSNLPTLDMTMTFSDCDYDSLFGSDSELEPEPEPESKTESEPERKHSKKRKHSPIILKSILKKTKIYNVQNDSSKIEKIDYANLYLTRFIFLKYVDKVEKLFDY